MKLTTLLFYSLFLFSQTVFAKTNLSDAWIDEPAAVFKQHHAVTGKHYMISTSDILASQAGANMLKKGGNVIDAIIAAQMVLNVVEPQSSGIGGGGFLLYFDAKTNKTTFFNGREIAPQHAHENMFLDEHGQALPFIEAVKGGKSVGTPGVLKILKQAHEQYGKLPWKELFEPAISIATNGFVMKERLHHLAQDSAYLAEFQESADLYLNKNTGQTIKNIALAKTFKTIANQGIEPFYEGQIARNIVQSVQHSKINPGYLSLEDLKNYRSTTGDLICASYRQKYNICSMPLPSSGGITLLQILGILENFDLTKFKANSVETIHLISEATRLAYADRNQYIGDVKHVPVTQMLDKKYLKSRSQLIKQGKALDHIKAGDFKEKIVLNHNAVELPSTTHLSAIDPEGNAISFTSSIEYFFGSGLSVEGFLLNNQMTDFSFLPEIDGQKVANRVQPFKQPRSSMTPVFVFDDHNQLLMIIGSPGGPNIIQYVLKAIVAHLDFNIDLQEAISMPNFVVLNDILKLEKGTKIINLAQQLNSMGHHVTITDITSGLHGIIINDNQLIGAADPRRGGAAVGK